ncbi:hypothetical protein MMC08_008243 [Hypocenomyce scalaris]|nr:hypothetical protein [Hypocenomyce scalaris]
MSIVSLLSWSCCEVNAGSADSKKVALPSELGETDDTNDSTGREYMGNPHKVFIPKDKHDQLKRERDTLKHNLEIRDSENNVQSRNLKTLERKNVQLKEAYHAQREVANIQEEQAQIALHESRKYQELAIGFESDNASLRDELQKSDVGMPLFMRKSRREGNTRT